MATDQGIREFLAALKSAGLLTERKGAPAGLDEPEAKRALARFWFGMLQEVADGDLQAATVAYMRNPETCQWYPQPGTILAHVPGRRAGELDRSDELWGLVMQAIKFVGSHGIPSWPEADRAAIDAGLQALGGWQHLCQTLMADDVAAQRASFRAVVRTVQQRNRLAVEDAKVLGLAGSTVKRIGATDAR